MRFISQHAIVVPLEFTVMSEVDVAEYLKMGVLTLRRHVSKGNVPKPIKLGKISLWPTLDISKLLQNATEQKRSKTQKK